MSSSKFLLVIFGVLLLAACGSEPQGDVPVIKSARAERDVADGAATLRSTVQVQFDRSVTLAPSKVPLASHFEFSVPEPFQGRPPKRVLVAQASLSEGNGRLIELHVDALLPEGSVLKVARKAFKEGEEGELTANVESEMTPSMALLASGALGVTRPDLLAAQESPPLTAADRDPQAQRLALEASLQKRGADANLRKATIGRFESIPAEIVPSAKLRAALAGLTGTFAEPAIDFLLTGENCTGKPAALIAFQPPPGQPKLVARATLNRDGRRVISLNPTTEGERLEHIMPLLVHEAIHCDNDDGRFEEVAATAFDTYFYLNLVAGDPELVNAKTPLARELNIDAIAMVNSGRRLPESVGILKSPGVPRAVPNSTSLAAAFSDIVVAAYPQVEQNDSAEEPLAKKYVDRLTEAAGMKPGAAFNLRYLDELLGRAIDPEVMVAAIGAFGLSPV